ncbi:MAG: DUF167 domain-containing protein [Armatimonadota bacterium]
MTLTNTTIKLHVTPRGSRNEVIGWRGDVLCVKITAAPVEGAANAAVLKFLADVLGVRKSRLHIVSGEKNREKTVSIYGLSNDELRSILRERCGL